MPKSQNSYFVLHQHLNVPHLIYVDHTCQPPEFQNLETSRNPRVVRMRFTRMSEDSPRIPRRLSEFSRHLSVEQYQRF